MVVSAPFLQIKQIIDLCPGGYLSVEHARRLDDLEPLVRDEYTEYIGKLAADNDVEGTVWFLAPLCRNPFASDILERLLRLTLLREYLEKGFKEFELVVDSSDMRAVTQQLVSQYPTQVNYKVIKKRKHQTVLRKIGQLFYNTLNSYLWPRLIQGKRYFHRKSIMVEASINARTFNLDTSLDQSYFPGLLELAEKVGQKEKIVFVVLSVFGLRSLRSYYRFWQSVRHHKQPFIVKEDWLTWIDYLWALKYSFIMPFRITRVPRWRTLDLSGLVKFEIRRQCGSSELLTPLLAYRMWANLKRSGFQLEGVIDWSENQTIDRALCLGVKKNFPSVRIKGYQGFFISEYYTALDIAEYEKTGGTTPDEVLVVSEKLIKPRKKYCSNQRVSTAPAFRFTPLDRPGIEKKLWHKKILVGLPIFYDLTERILEVCGGLPQELKDKLRVRPHPYFQPDHLDFLCAKHAIPRDLLVDGGVPVQHHFVDSELLISTGSSLCAQAVSAGIRVAVIGSQSGPTLNPLIFRVPDHLWRTCYSPQEVTDYFFEKQRPDMLCGEEELFVPVTESGVSAMLKFSACD